MVLIDNGLDRITVLISNDLDNGQVGTATARALQTNTSLGTAMTNSTNTLTKTTSDQQFTINYSLLSTQGATATVSEFVEYGNATAEPYARVVFTGIDFEKDGDFDITISKRYFIKNV